MEKTKSGYVSISTRSIWSTLGLLALGGFTYLQIVGYIIPGMKEIFNLEEGDFDITRIGLMWVPIIGYLLVASNTCLTINIFKPLKLCRGEGLVWFLFLGLIISLILSLLMGLSTVPDTSFLVGLIFLLVPGFLTGLWMGLTSEFKFTAPA